MAAIDPFQKFSSIDHSTWCSYNPVSLDPLEQPTLVAETRVERRLAAILAADVVGYSRLMGQDDAGTLAVLKARRKDVLDPLLARHRGRIFKVTGDGVLVEFGSAVNAAQCAIELQRGMALANGDLPETRQIVLRIGINLGDVMVEGSDLYGDGVNIAARLEGIAEPGGIWMSGAAFDQIKNKVDTSFEDLGTQTLKNIVEPVRVYRITDTLAALSAATKIATEKPSIAVLPLTNMSGDLEQEYFSDGITEDIITELSRFRNVFVIARNSSFAFKGQAADLREVGRKLGAQYMVEGSVRRASNRIRITAQLIDANLGNHLWSEHYDRKLRDIFAIQDEVTTAIVGAVVGQVQAAGIDKARRRRTGSLEAYDWFLRGLEHFNRSGSDDTGPAKTMFERAIQADPNFAQAHAFLAETLVEVAVAFWTPATRDDQVAAMNQARMAAEKAVSLDGNDARCHCSLANVLLLQKSFELAAHHIDVARRLNPNDADVAAHQSILQVFTGRPQQALRALALARKLNPISPNWYCEPSGLALYSLKRYAEAAEAFERATAKRPYVYRYLAACYSQMGCLSRAKALVTESLRLQPGFTLNEWVAAEPYKSQADLDHMLEGMRKAGLPE
jgi:TolB-like protein/Flp pilus assembly protein TadD